MPLQLLPPIINPFLPPPPKLLTLVQLKKTNNTPPPSQDKTSTSSTKTETVSTPESANQTTSEPISTAQEETTTPVASDIDFTSFDEVKEKVIAVITTGMTKSFLRQQCHIAKIEGSTVTIGVASKGLLSIGKRQQKDIEAGFSKVYGKPIKIFLFADKDLKNKKSNIEIPHPHENQANSTPSPATTSPSLPTAEENQNSVANQPSSPPVNLGQSITTPPSIESQSTTNIPQPNSTSSTEEVQKAAESVAKSFKGEIVLTETKEIEIEPVPDTNHVTIVNRPSVEDFDDEDDIPF